MVELGAKGILHNSLCGSNVYLGLGGLFLVAISGSCGFVEFYVSVFDVLDLSHDWMLFKQFGLALDSEHGVEERVDSKGKT